MSRLIQASILALLIVAPVASVRAELAIALSNVTLAPGGIGTMNFTVTSGRSDQLMDFGLGLQITKVGSPTSLIQFTTSQPDPYGNANYVFAGESFNADQIPSLPFWGTPKTTSFISDTIPGGDSDDSTQGYVTIPSTSGGLHTFLASVQFSAPKGATAGDTFQVVLSSDPGLTYFDGTGGTLGYSVQAGGGLITIASVPEPSSILTGLIGAAFLGAEGFRRRRRCRRLARCARADRS